MNLQIATAICCCPALVMAQIGHRFQSTAPRVFVAEAQSGSNQTIEVIKTLQRHCESVIVTMNTAKADYSISFDHEYVKGLVRRDNRIAVTSVPDGDVVYSDSTRSLGSAVKNSCDAILKDFARRGPAEVRQTPPPVNRIWSNGTLLDSQTTDLLFKKHPVQVRPNSAIYAIQGDRFVYLVEGEAPSGRRGLRNEAPDIDYVVKGETLVVMGDQVYETHLLLAIKRQTR